MPQAPWIADVLDFWFRALKSKDWWSGAPAVDAAVRVRFGPLRDRLRHDPPNGSELDGRGHVAAVIVLDQFSRNLFRQSPEAFAADATALALTVDAIDRGLDRDLVDAERHFLYMPLAHSEDPAIQERSLVQFGLLKDPRALRSAKSHHATIARFGRFPHRNAALGRPSTPAESAFLATHGPR